MAKKRMGKNTQTAVKTFTPQTKEEKINDFLGDPMGRAADDADIYPTEEPVDNIRHTSAGRYTQEALSRKLGGSMAANIAAIGATNLFGLAHEARNFFKKDSSSSFIEKARESGEDMFNNAVGSVIGALPISGTSKKNFIRKLSQGNLLADGYVSNKEGVKKGLSSNVYFKDQKGKVNRSYKIDKK